MPRRVHRRRDGAAADRRAGRRTFATRTDDGPKDKIIFYGGADAPTAFLGGNTFMSRFAEVVLLAAEANTVMSPLTQENDGTRPWNNIFVPIESQWPGSFGLGWAAEFTHRRHWDGLLEYLESMAWPRPETVQVLIHDEGDDCFGLWMMFDGKLVEVSLPRTERESYSSSTSSEVSNLYRTDGSTPPD
ncbi:hypothetical protein M1L60_35935 [Actinoplanes sp. TRM 88003]|uniref:Uncharacterized protein n=1 Tax=Paractinoplanes aksuensis TaxID=2939490 RepID=A0ABT1DZI8_9ACTN|nr:hypothetical protein [Actinoplanes aksuensis]MCO8275983.1 hypothetical protein [Actinoplanes aksuensis]